MWWSFAFATTVGGEFSAVEVDVPCSIELVEGDTGEVELVGSPEDGRVELTIEDGVLGVHGSGPWSERSAGSEEPDGSVCSVRGSHGPLTRVAAAGAARVQVGSLEGRAEVLALGGAEVVVDAVQAERLKVDLAGGASLTVQSGRVAAARYRVSGASMLEAEGLKADQVQVTASAASEARVSVTHRLRAQASGASRITVDGRPTQREVRADRTSTVEAP